MKHAIPLVLLASLPLAFGQKQEESNFLSDPSVFKDIRGILPAYLKGKAFTLLDERRKAVARMSSMAEVKARQQYLRERMWGYLGGQPERTPLNQLGMGALDRGAYRIEQ